MTQNTNITAALRHCEGGTTEAIHKKKPLAWIASFLAMTFGLLSSCEKEIEFNGEHSNPKLVINSLVEPGKPVGAAISKSFFFLDNDASTLAPDDLVATLYVNGNRIGEMTPHFDTVVSYDIWDPNDSNLGHVRKVYTHDYCPVDGDIVKITASANGFEDVEGVTSALPKAVDCQMEVEIMNWYSQYSYPYYDGDEHEGDSLLEIAGTLNLTLILTDPNPGKTDYFRLFANKSKGNYSDENWYYLIIAKSSFLSCRIPFRNENECRDKNTDQKQPTKNCDNPSFHGKRRVNVHGIVQMV